MTIRPLEHEYALRQEVSFERWFSQNIDDLLESSQKIWNARLWAVLSIAESTVKVGVEAVTWLISKVTENCWDPITSPRHADVLSTQWTSLKLSWVALYSPNKAREWAGEPDDGIIACRTDQWEWGTILEKEGMTVPFWRTFECSCFSK